MRVQFSTRQILLATSLIALVFVVCFWIRKLSSIDPSSESVWVDGKVVKANWQDGEWRHTTGLFLPATPFVSPDWNGQGMVKVHQPLLTIAYKNYFGNEVYRANVYLDGHRSDDWLHYWIQPMRTGGGITDGGTAVSCDQLLGTSSIILVATQYLNSQRHAKRLELVFDRVGDTFIQRIATKQSVADGAGK
jgi:hypothetical protein